MLKPILIAVGGTIAAIWALCAWLYFSPLDRAVDPRIGAPPTAADLAPPASSLASQRQGGPVTVAPSGGHAPPAAAAGDDAAAPPAQREAPPVRVLATGSGGEEEMHRRALANAQGAAAAPPAVPAPAPRAPQYSSLGGYVLDADSVVVAPPVAADGPGSAAERRRQARLSQDIGKLP